jgi:hypothetical protein
MAGKASTTVDVRLSQDQIDRVIAHVTESAIEHRAEEIVAERYGSLDDVARKEVESGLLTRLTDRGVRAARYAGHCSEFERMYASIFGDSAPYPRDSRGVDCRGWKLSDDGETERRYSDSEDVRPARKLANDEWRYAGSKRLDDGRRLDTYSVSKASGLYPTEGEETEAHC